MLLILISLLQLSHGLVTDHPYFRNTSKPQRDIKYRQEWFVNYKDHFSGEPLSRNNYNQRFYVVDQYVEDDVPPVAILYLCGENNCLFPMERLFPASLAKYFKAVYFVIEHRYYGVSQPTPDWSIENLAYLNHEQALADYAFFIESTNRDRYKGKTPPKWIIIGGSYAGALAAWFRYKFPHLVAGALSSSGVVVPLVNFHQFDQQIAADFREDYRCYSIMKHYHNKVEEYIKNEKGYRDFIKSFGPCSNIEDTSKIGRDEFLFYFADMAALYPQYGRRQEICSFVTNLFSNITRDIKLQLIDICAKGYTDGNRLEDYTYDKIRDTKIVPENFIRQWTYQYCTTYAWFQTPSESTPLRFKDMNIEYWEEYCRVAIGTRGSPDVEHTNTIYAKEEIGKHATNIYFTQAKNDPWRWAGMQKKDIKNEGLQYGFIDCKDCGHCRELETESENDPEILLQVRAEIYDAITSWIE